MSSRQRRSEPRCDNQRATPARSTIGAVELDVWASALLRRNALDVVISAQYSASQTRLLFA